MPYFLLLFTTLSSLCTAAELHDYETHDSAPIHATQDYFDRYLLGLRSGSERHQAIRPENRADAIEKGLLAVLAANDIDDSQAVNHRRAILWDLMARWARELPENEKPALAARIKTLADRALVAFKSKWRSNDKVYELFDALHLWSESNWWFFQIPKNEGERFVNKHRERIRGLLPQLSETERQELAQSLRAIRPRAELPLALLSELSPLTEDELRDYFKLLGNRYDRKSHEFLLSDRSAKVYEDEAEFLKPAAIALLKELQKGDPKTAFAFEKARSYFERKDRSGALQFFARARVALPGGVFNDLISSSPCTKFLSGP